MWWWGFSEACAGSVKRCPALASKSWDGLHCVIASRLSLRAGLTSAITAVGASGYMSCCVGGREQERRITGGRRCLIRKESMDQETRVHAITMQKKITSQNPKVGHRTFRTFVVSTVTMSTEVELSVYSERCLCLTLRLKCQDHWELEDKAATWAWGHTALLG